MTPKRVVLMAIAILFAVFILQNAEVVEVRFLFWGTEASRAIVLLVTFFMGLACGWLTVWKHKKPGTDKSQTQTHQSDR
jgi:putative membrane protein